MSVSQIPPGLEAVLPTGSQDIKKEDDPLGRDAFLKMLLAQLQHQDPLNPMEGADFSSQLAQFSSLEQLFNVNDHLESISTSVVSDGANNVLDYIGKEVMCENDTLKLLEGIQSGGLFTLDATTEVAVSIFDDMGRELTTLYPGQLEPGTHQIDWNGYDRTGTSAPDGAYRFELAAIGENGLYEPITASASGLVTGVTYENGTPYLEVDGKLIDPATVVKIRQQDGSI
jgi:flagellar basal-body rod modification protein FlgD